MEESVFTGIAYDDVPIEAGSLADLTVGQIRENIDNGVFANLPVFYEHANTELKHAVGRTLGGVLVPSWRADGTQKHVLMLTYKLDPGVEGAKELITDIRDGVLPGLSLSHNAISKKISEVSVVSLGMRKGTTRLADGIDLVKTIRNKDKTRDASSSSIRSRYMGLANSKVPVDVRASKLGGIDDSEQQRVLDEELAFLAVINNPNTSTEGSSGPQPKECAAIEAKSETPESSSQESVQMASAPALQTQPVPQSLPVPQPTQPPSQPQPQSQPQSQPRPPQDAPVANPKPAETPVDAKQPVAKEDFEALLGRLTQKSGSDPDTEALLIFANKTAEQLNAKEQELKVKSLIFNQAVKQATETLERKFRNHDAETRALLSHFIKNGGAEQYVLSGGKMMPFSEEKGLQPEEAPLKPAADEKRSMSVNQTNPIQQVQPIQLVQPIQQQPAPRPTIDTQQLRTAWKKATFVDTNTGIISPPMEMPDPRVPDQTMNKTQEQPAETIEERLQRRFPRNSFMRAFIENERKFLDAFNPSNQMIQASGSDRFFSTKDQERFQASRAQGYTDTLAFMNDTLNFRPYRIGSKRSIADD